MRVSTLAMIATLGTSGILIAAATSSGRPKPSSPAVGSHVILDLGGPLARRYHQMQSGESVDGNEIQISTSAHVAQKFKNGHYRIEHSLTVNSKTAPPRMITLTAIVAESAFEIKSTPKGAATYSSPTDSNPGSSKNQTTSYHLTLNELRATRIRNWKLDGEVKE